MTTPKRGLAEMIEELKELEKKATPGPYHVERVDHEDEITYEVHSNVRDSEGERSTFHVVFRESDCIDHGVTVKRQADLYAASRNALPVLLHVIEEMKKALELYVGVDVKIKRDGNTWNYGDVAREALAECEALATANEESKRMAK